MKRIIKRKQLNKLIILAGMLLLAGAAKAADYVFIYNNGYLAVDNDGNIVYTTTFSPQCVWTCSSNTNTNPTAATLGNTSRFLYTTIGNQKYWLVGSNTDGQAITTTTTAPGTARWRNSNNRLYWYQTNNYYAYYREDTWRTSRRNNGNSYGVNAYMSGNNSGTDYRSTTYTVTTTPATAQSTSTTSLSVPTIAPLSATLYYNDTETFDASATATTTTNTIPAHTVYTIGTNPTTIYYYYNGTVYTSTDDFTQQTETHPDITYSWALTGAANDYLSPTSGTGASITITHSPQTPSDVSSTLSVTATAAGQTQTSTSNATVTAKASTVDPTSVSITSNNPMTVYVGNTGNITYTLTPTPCYQNVTFTSANAGIATVSSTGVVTAVATGQTTISVKAYKYSNPAQYVEATVTVTVKNKVATPTIDFDTIGNGSTATTTITSTTGADIYYTINGSNPTSSSTHYTGSFVVNEGDVVRAIAVMTGNSNWDDSEIATEEYHACGTNDPTITYIQSGTTATVTITAETGATIYYTTNGNNPNSGSSHGTTTVTLTDVAGGTTVKAYAKNPGCGASNIVSKVIVLSGVSGGVVTLNDREDHNWSYYSDADQPIRSLSPADVKITYYGDGIMMTGSTDYTDESTDYITSTHTDYKVGAKVNVGGENENTFVYYKTLERGDATDAAWTFNATNQSSAASRCPYTPIPNPFQVRPRYGDRTVNGITTDANDFTGWRGFQCWRLKSVTGGAVYATSSGGTALSTGAVINAETEYYFAPDAEYGMEVELEAVWARAYVKKANQANENPVGTNNVGYERNFCVPTTGAGYTLYTGTGKRITNDNHIPVTISCYYPDGTAPDNTDNSIQNAAVTLVADTKFENIPINLTSNTLTLANYDIVMGRGCTGTINRLQGISGDYNGDLNYTMRIENGTVTTLAYVAEVNCTVSGRVTVKAIMGCDYDRAKKVNSLLSISNSANLFFTRDVAFSNESNKDQKVFDLVVKSGEYQKSYWTNTDDETGFTYTHSMYCGANFGSSSTNAHYPGLRHVVVEGGALGSINGGRGTRADGNNSNPTATTPGTDAHNLAFDLRIKKDAVINGCVFGGAANTSAWGSKRIVVTGGEIRSWIAGGANGTNTTSGDSRTRGGSYIYVGGNAKVGGPNALRRNGTYGGQIFGAGRGNQNQAASMDSSFVVIADNAQILKKDGEASGNVYGGGNIGYIAYKTNIYILGGTVEGAVYGGAFNNALNIPEVNITMKGGLVEGGVYGGSNSNGTISGDVTMQIDGGQVGTTSTTANIHGGGLGSPTRVSGNVDLTLGTSGQTTEGVTVYGDVYGGSALGHVNGGENGTTASDTYHTYVTLNKGTINGSLYGGGLGNNSTQANVYGPVQVKVYGGSVNKTDANGANGSGGVYGANNVNGAPQRSVTVDIYGTDPAPSADEYALFSVYGGGNQAAYTYGNGYPKVTVHNCNNSIEYVYGGGNAAAVASTDVKIYGGNKIGTVFGGGNGQGVADNFVMVSGNALTNIYGGTILRVFAGNNTNGTISGNVTLNVNKEAESGHDSCPMKIGEVYGGGNLAAGKAGTVTIGCTGDLVALGDNEHYGVDQEGITYVYGGANQAGISNNIVLNINSGIVENVFGGNNTSGAISGSIQVNINKDNAATCASDWYVGNVFGGGNLAQYTGSPTVNILNGTVSGNVYGGGKGVLVDGNDHGEAGKVTGNPQVNIGDNETGHTATVLGEVYGGGDAATVDGIPVIVVNDCNTSIGYLYGGGNAADVNGTNITFNAGTVTNDAFGGGHGDKNATNPEKYADVNGNVVFNVSGGTFGRVFAGSNSRGTITGTSALTINKTGSCAMKIREVYGGGNEAAGNAGTITVGCTGALTSQASNPDQIGTTLEGIGAVYGGANQANIGTSSNNSNITLTINSGMVGNVYGGNNTSGTIYGDIQVNINKTSDDCGWYVGDVFGGGNLADYSGTPDVNIIAGTVSGSVFGGGNAADVGGSDVAVSGGQINGGVYGGCNSEGNTGAVTISLTGGQVGVDATHRADVFGGGFGSATTTSGNITVTLGNTTVYGDIYGGSALGKVNGSTDHTTTLTISGSDLNGTIYGGGKGQNSPSAITAVSNGNVIINYNTANTNLVDGIYGGANINGNVKGNIEVNVNANVGTSTTNTVDVFGGGLGAATTTEGNVTVKFGKEDLSEEPTIYGNLYGGSSQGQVNASGKTTNVYVYNGTVNGNVYGGGLGVKNTSGHYDNGNYVVANDSIHAVVNGDALVYIGTAAQTTNNVVITGNVFGGSDLCGNTLGDITVHIYHTKHNTTNSYPTQTINTVALLEGLNTSSEYFALQGVYGGGNLAHYQSTGSSSTKKTSVYVHGCDNTIRYLYGGGNAANTTANYIQVDGGRFFKIFGGGNGEEPSLPGANITNGDATTIINGGLYNYIFGGSNTKGNIAGDMDLQIDPDPTLCGLLVACNLYGGGNLAPSTGGSLTIKCGDMVIGDVYGGANLAPIVGDVELNIEGGTLNNVFGGSKGQLANGSNPAIAANITGNVTLNLKGGTMKSAFGGSDQNGNITGKITVNVIDVENPDCPLVVDTIYGAGNLTPYTPNDSVTGIKPVTPIVNFQHMKSGSGVGYDVFGGGLGATAIVTANPKVIIGGTASDEYAKVGRNVYGGGSKAAVVGNTKVIVRGYADANNSIVGNVFGGGSQAGVSGTTSVQIANGTVGAGVYGGCNVEGTVGSNVTVSVTGGTIGTAGTTNGAVYGGGLGADTKVKGNVAVTIGGGTINNDVYGGSAKGLVNCNDAGNGATSGSKTDVTLNAGTINGSLYGGGHGIDNANAHVWGPVQVTVNGGTVTGSVYGCNNANGAPQGTVKVDIYGTDTPGSGYALANVFGGGNLAGYGGTPEVTIHNCDNSIGFVYGGGNAAPVAATNVKVYGGNTIGNVFGGGNGTGVADDFVMVTGNVLANIYGGTISKVFGGNNSSGTITGTITLNVDKQTEPGDGHTACAMKIGEVYGGGNMAAGNAGTVTIGCTGDLVALGTGEHYGVDQEGIRYVYGGANKAGINNNIVLNINSGIVENVFGGNNTSGNISGTITVNIEKDSDCGWYVGNVYGGGNLASYSNTGSYPAVNIKNGTVSGDVFGGGLGASAKVRSNPVVTVGDPGTAAYVATVLGNVYGGGSAAMVGDDDTSNPSTNNTTVLIQKSNTTVSKVFGGGMAAGVTGTTGVTITDGTVNTGVYGGCDSQGDVKGKVTVNVKGGTLGSAANLALTTPVTVDVYGGGYGAATTTSGDVEVNIGECTNANTHNDVPKIYGDVYGGSALGKVNGSNANTTTVNVLNGRLYTSAESATTTNGQTYYKYHGGNVYGGGLGRKADNTVSPAITAVEAEEYGKIIVNIGAPGNTKSLAPDTNIGEAIIDGNVYGCNNTNGSPQDDVTVNIYRTHREETDTITYTGPLTPTFALNDVFGGGNQADYNPTATGKKSTVQIHGCHNTINRVFGGSNAAASGSSSVPVEVNTNINGGRFYNVFGGGNGEVSAANIYGNVKLEIHGGIVNEFYIGSNQNGSISGSSNVTVDQSSGCDEITITEFYCGGKYADYIGNINAEITCSQGLNVNYLYGGCKEAHVRGNVHLTVNGGTYDYIFGGSRGTTEKGADIQGNVLLEVYGGTVRKAIFGGSNVRGAIGGTVTVNVEDKFPDDDCALEVSTADVYGGGNKADYPGTASTGSPLSGTITHSSPYNYPAVNIKNATVKNVFGGGLEAKVNGDPQVYIKKGSKVLGNVYGGGNMGEVTGNPRVIINGKQVN